MTTLGASLLEGLLAADAGHRGPRTDCGTGHQASFVAYRVKQVDTVLGPVRCAVPGTTAPPAVTAWRHATTNWT